MIRDTPRCEARVGSGRLAADFAAKGIEIPLLRPLHRRRWVRRLALGAAGLAGLVGAVALGFLGDWHDTRRAELARQRRGFAEFLASEEFAQFTRAVDAQLVALNNFIAVQPAAAGAAWPAVTAFEARHGAPSWAGEVMPLPVSAAGQPARVLAAHHAIATLLAQRGHRFATEAGGARSLFLRLLAPSLRAFLRRAPASDFSMLRFDPVMQEAALAAFGARHGPDAGLHDAERMFALYAKVGPAMWQAIERDREAQAKASFTLTTR